MSTKSVVWNLWERLHDPSKVHNSVAKELGSSWLGWLCMGASCLHTTVPPLDKDWLHLLGLLSPWHKFTDLGQTFLRHRRIERWGQTDLSPQTIWEHAHGTEQKHCTLLHPIVWQRLSSTTDLPLKSSGELPYSLQAKYFKKILGEFQVLLTAEKLIKKSGV